MRYQKDHKIRLWEAVSEQDEVGAFHTLYRPIGAYWAHYRPVSITSQYASAAVHEIADCVFTINKPKWFDGDSVLTDLFTVWKGRVLKVVRVEDVDGMSRGDIRLFMQQDMHMSPETFAHKQITDVNA